MIILPDKNIARPTKVLLPMHRRDWSNFGCDFTHSAIVFQTWIAQAYRLDHSMVWHGHFEDRDDADAFMWALYSGTLKNDPYLKRLPVYCYRFDQRQIPIWAPGGFDPELLEDFSIMYNMASNIGIGPSSGNWGAPGDCYGVNNRAGEFYDCIGPGGGAAAGGPGWIATGGGGGGFARRTDLAFSPGQQVAFAVGSGGGGGAATPGGANGAGGTAHTYFYSPSNPGVQGNAGAGGVAGGQGQGGSGGGGANAGNYGTTGGRSGGATTSGFSTCATGGGAAANPSGNGANGGDVTGVSQASGGGAGAGLIYGPWGPGSGGAGVRGANGVTGTAGSHYGGGGGAGQNTGSTTFHQYGGAGGAGLIVIRYEPQYAPTVSWISPNSGPTGGGQAVRINGSFTEVTGANIGGATLTGVTWNGTDVYGTTAAGGAGTYNVNVYRSNGPSPGVGASMYTYVTPPSVSSCSPSSGPTGGGQYVIVNGSNLSGVTWVNFDGVGATSVSVIDANRVQCYTPARPAGGSYVTLGNSYGSGGAWAFTFVTPPSISACAPTTGPTTPNNAVMAVITGANLDGVSSVTFGGTAASPIGVVNSTTVHAWVPAHAAGLVSVSVTNGYGTASGNLFTYVTPPSLSAISSPVPPIGLIFGGTDLTLSGANLAGATDVKIGGVAATNVVVVNANTITCRTPAHADGLVSITATNTYGTATLANCFTYLLPASGFNMPMMGI